MSADKSLCQSNNSLECHYHGGNNKYKHQQVAHQRVLHVCSAIRYEIDTMVNISSRTS